MAAKLQRVVISRNIVVSVFAVTLLGAAACTAHGSDRPRSVSLVDDTELGLLLAGTSGANRIAIQPTVIDGPEAGTLDLKLESHSLRGSSATFEIRVVGRGFDQTIDMNDAAFASEGEPWSRVVELGRVVDPDGSHVDVTLRVESTVVTQRIVIQRTDAGRYRANSTVPPSA